jgi:hypothetical protein
VKTVKTIDNGTSITTITRWTDRPFGSASPVSQTLYAVETVHNEEDIQVTDQVTSIRAANKKAAEQAEHLDRLATSYRKMREERAGKTS